MKTYFGHKQVGVTVVELVAVMVILGIVVAVTIPKWTASSTTLGYEADRVLNDIRYAQALSMTTGQRYRWVRVSSNTYQILNQNGSPITLPLGGTVTTLANGIQFGSFTNVPNNLIAFDSQGVPYTTSSLPGTALSHTATMPVTLSGHTFTVHISAQTGYGIVT